MTRQGQVALKFLPEELARDR